jgi:purine-binding chemotaxis protein CheW
VNELHLIVVIAGEKVAFRACDVQSVVELDRITPAPRAPAYIAGLAALRSRALTVIDCMRSLELERREGELPSRKAVVVEHQSHLYALLVGSVEDVVEAKSEPDTVPAELGRGWRRVARGIVETDLGVMLVVDLPALIAGPEEPGQLKASVTDLRHG